MLTGMGRDGAAGAVAINRQGGVVLVQEPKSAEADGMPRAALASADLVLPLEAIAGALTSLCSVFGTRALLCGDPRPSLPRVA